MRGWTITWMLALGMLLSVASANEPIEANPPVNQEGLTALDAFRARHPKVQVLGMVGFFGQAQPVQWLILTGDPGSSVPLREYVFGRNQVLAERVFAALPGQDLPHLPLVRETLSLTSEKAFGIAETRAKDRSTPFESVHYQLRVRDEGREPVWMLNLLNRAHASIGVLYLSARSGEVLRETWVHPPGQPDEGISAR